MRKVLLLTATTCFFAGFGGAVRADDATNAILEKAVKAHGGIDKLTKLKKAAIQSKAKGKINQLGGIDVTLETSAQSGKSRQVIEGEVANTKFKQFVLFDGEKLRIFVNDKEIKIDDKKMVKEVKEKVYEEKVVGLVFLKEKGFKMEPLGEVKVNGKAALGIRVSSEGHRDVNLFFDKEKGLLVKTESRTIDFMSGEDVSEEKILDEYKETHGLLMPTKVVVLRGGKELMTMEIEEFKIVDKFDDDNFTKP